MTEAFTSRGEPRPLRTTPADIAREFGRNLPLFTLSAGAGDQNPPSRPKSNASVRAEAEPEVLLETPTRRPPRRPGGGSPGDGDGGRGGGPGGGGGGPPDPPGGPLGGGPSRDPILHQLLARLVSAEEKRADLDAAGSSKREELSFKVDAALPEITTDDPALTVEAFDKLERVLNEARVMDYRTWVKFLRHEAKGAALQFIEASLLRDPGLSLIKIATETDSRVNWAKLYSFLRIQVFRFADVRFELIRERAEAKWRSVTVTDKYDYDAIMDSIVNITKAWSDMMRCEAFDDTDRSHQRLMIDLKNKVPRGSKLPDQISSKDWEPNTFDQWISMIHGLIRNYPRGQKRREPNRKVAERPRMVGNTPLAPGTRIGAKVRSKSRLTDLTTPGTPTGGRDRFVRSPCEERSARMS